MKYSCSNCMYTYDETIGEESMGIEPGTGFYELSEGFYCPVCSEGKEVFGEIVEEVNYPIDPENLTNLEAEHVPLVIDSADGWIKIQIGEKLHAHHDEHFVSLISLLDEHDDVIDEQILVSSEEAIVEFDMDLFEIAEIRVNCNTHGVWGRKFEHE